MKAAYIDGYGGPERLVVGERAQPNIGADEMLVDVKAASINPVDYKIRAGKLRIMLSYPMPLILGQDLSGVVVAVGSKDSRFKPGDEIFARLNKQSIGAFAQFAAVREADAALKPTSLTHIEAASIPLVGLTAWQVMNDLVHLQPGQRALIHAGSGGVGSFAIQLAKHLGAHVTTTASARNTELCKRLGAEVVIDYKTQRFDDAKAGGASDLDFVFDTQGGDTLLRSIGIVKRGGWVVTIGGVPTPRVMREWGLASWKEWLAALLNRKFVAAAMVGGVNFDYHFMSPSGAQLAEIAQLLDAKKIVPVVDRVFALQDARAAFAYAEAGHAVGKVIITP